MHHYSNTQVLSPLFYVLLSALSVASAWLLHLLLTYLKLDQLWWIEFPSVLGFYAIFWKWFDKKGWTISFVRKLFRITTPNLSGIWNSQADTEIENQQHTVTAQANIKQTWSQFKVSIEWQNSTSVSVSASLHEVSSNEFEIIYQYLNTPKPLAPQTMNMHRGTAWLALSADQTQMQGEYYSGRGRNKFGSLSFKRRSELTQ